MTKPKPMKSRMAWAIVDIKSGIIKVTGYISIEQFCTYNKKVGMPPISSDERIQRVKIVPVKEGK